MVGFYGWIFCSIWTSSSFYPDNYIHNPEDVFWSWGNFWLKYFKTQDQILSCTRDINTGEYWRGGMELVRRYQRVQCNGSQYVYILTALLGSQHHFQSEYDYCDWQATSLLSSVTPFLVIPPNLGISGLNRDMAESSCWGALIEPLAQNLSEPVQAEDRYSRIVLCVLCQVPFCPPANLLFRWLI